MIKLPPKGNLKILPNPESLYYIKNKFDFSTPYDDQEIELIKEDIIIEKFQQRYSFHQIFDEMSNFSKRIEDVEKYLFKNFQDNIEIDIEKLRNRGVNIYKLLDQTNLSCIQYNDINNEKYMEFIIKYGVSESDIYRKIFINGTTNKAIDQAVEYGMKNILKQLNKIHEKQYRNI